MTDRQELGGFPLDLLPTVRVPGLPQDNSLVTLPAELNGVELPWYTLSEISRFFFQKERHWLSRKLNGEENRPPVGHRLYFTPPPEKKIGDGGEPKRWTLGEVERMVVWMHESRTIKYREYLIARQIVAWVARGYGAYDG